MTSLLSEADLAWLEERGISATEAARQMELLVRPPEAAPLVRPATRGDGIRHLVADDNEVLAAFEAAAAAGRIARFVPASGAATRMFAGLLEALGQDDPARHPDAIRFHEEWAAFPFSDPDGVVETDPAALLRHALSEDGLGLAGLPKGLVPFHRSAGADAHTAFEDHLREAAQVVQSSAGVSRCHVHFTVSAEHQPAFERQLCLVRRAVEERHDVRLEVDFSNQSRATDTLALAPGNQPFREEDGTLLLRPGGHGALIGNLSRFAKRGADLVTVRNIDNILPEDQQEQSVLVERHLLGMLASLEVRVHERLAQLDDPAISSGDLGRIAHFAERELQRAGASALLQENDELCRLALVTVLERPLRICGMVPASGDVGGGPFWVRDDSLGESLQIVEGAQIDTHDPTSRRALDASTHFNPVEMACALRDRYGAAWDLEAFVDPNAWFVARKSRNGRRLRALERPGLWNGAMGGWNTVFVEIPGNVFAPVKSVFDLLGEKHQGS